MEQILRPTIFDADPHSSDATKKWNHWFRNFSAYIHSVDSAKLDKLEILIRFVDHTVYDYITDCADYDAAISLLQKLYIRPKNIVYSRHLLATCKQEPGQDVDQFVQKLKSLVKDCDFKAVSAVEHANEAVRDALITGLQSTVIREKLLSCHELDLNKAHEVTRALELAHKQSQSYTYGQPISCSLPDPIDSVKDDAPVTAATQPLCYFCGNSKHPRAKCPAREAVCKNCGKVGHFQRVCRSKTSKHQVGSAQDSILSSLLCAAAPNCLSRSVTNITVNGIELQALIDTGSSGSFVSSEVVSANKWKLIPDDSVITMASTAHSCSTSGYCCVSIQHKDVVYELFKLRVLPNLCADVLLGHDFLSLHDKIEIPFGGRRGVLTVCGLSPVNLTSPSLFTNLSPDCKPIATKSRRHSPEDEQFIISEVNRLLNDGIIEASTSPWRAQVLVTKNLNHKKRMVVDYSQTINRFTYLDAYPLPRLDQMIETISRYTVFSTLDLQSAYHQVPIISSEKPFKAFEAGGNLYQFCRIPFGVTNGVACFQRTINNILKAENVQDTFAYIDNVTVCGRTKAEHDHNLRHFLSVATAYNITLNDTKSIFATEEITLLGYKVSHGVIKPDPERMRPVRQLLIPTNAKSQQRVLGLFAYYSQWIPSFSNKIHPLVKNKTFPLPIFVQNAFENMKKELENAMLVTIDFSTPLVVETDASDIAIGASLSQSGRPVAFFSRTLTASEKHHSAIEKEAYAIVEAIRKWRHYLLGRHFKLVTDQRSVAFMYGDHQKGKIKNDKIERWKIELSAYSYDVIYRPGTDNRVADTLSRNLCANVVGTEKLKELHSSLCHPGVTRFTHFVRTKNLPFSVDDIRRVVSNCPTCAELKPKFCTSFNGQLVKATQPFERISIDFKGPLPSHTRNKYLLTIIDEYSRFPFAFPCADTSSSTVIHCLIQLFSIFGMPAYIHSDRGSAFMSAEIKKFLFDKGVATSHTTAYNPQCNGQVERLNATLWKTICLALKSRNLPATHWESVLHEALHCIRSLLCTSINCTPHERFFRFTRRSSSGTSLPTWLTVPGPVLLKRNDRAPKYDPIVEEVELLFCNPQYAHIIRADGKQETVSLRRLAPRGGTSSSPTDTEVPTTNPVENEIQPTPSADPICSQPQASSNTNEDPQSNGSADSRTYENLLTKQQRTHPYQLRSREA